MSGAYLVYEYLLLLLLYTNLTTGWQEGEGRRTDVQRITKK